MKRFCLPGLPYSQCLIWRIFPKVITSAISGQTKITPRTIYTNQQDRSSSHAMKFTGS